ncbi:hypothetical protein [Psychrobacillus sp. NPDC096623]|uniref:hypothetical protein n=1 Tax=Psychrobacillus sp. NPDC096623 TaxID=3364492 RepID=UPI003815C76E
MDTEQASSLLEDGAITEHSAGDIAVKEAVFQDSNPVEVATHWKEALRLFECF